MATLGISTNTRLLATAIINGNSLVDYSIHLHKQSWSPSKANLILNSLEPCVRRYCIKSIVLSIPHAYHQTDAFKYLLKRICAYCKQNRITIWKESVASLHALCPTDQKKTKKALMETVAVIFPELQYFLFKEKRNKSKYYVKLFEAVAVAMLQERR